MTAVRHKDVYRAGVRVGTARTWREVAALIGDWLPDAAVRLSREASEGPQGFYLKR